MMRLRIAGVVALIVAAVLVPAPASAAPATATASGAPADDIYGLVNQARWANGQAGLIRNAAMDQVAADWAAQMAANGAMSHNPDYAAQIPAGWSAAAENVAQGYPSGAATHDGWMGSSAHRANILGDFTDVGIAFLSSGGTTWGVEVFARYPGNVGPANPAPPPPPPPAAPAPAPAPAEAAPAEAVPAEPTPAITADPTPTATTDNADVDTETENRDVGRAERADDQRPSLSGWWIGLVGGVVALGAGAFWVLRRRRRVGS